VTEASIEALRARLAEAGDPERAEREKAYLESYPSTGGRSPPPLAFFGIGMPGLSAAAKQLAAEAPMDRARLEALVDGLWGLGIHDLRAIAVVLVEKHQRHLVAADLAWLEALLRDSHTWAYVDAIAVHAVGPLVVRCPELGAELDRWAADGDFWIRRSAMLALLLELRKGRGDAARFLRYADAMLDEREFFIRKAIGWILREYGKKQPEPVTAWLRPRIGRVSGVTIREAVKYLPEAERAELLAAYKRG
jgi:3-methyladenine DNA glycosylase AlkD